MKNFFLKGLQYFLMFQASILVSMLISLLFVIPIRFFVDKEMVESCIFVVLGFVLELAAITYCFYKEKTDFKDVGLKNFVLPCIVGVFFHFILSLFNGFYMYTAGISVSELGILWQSIASEILIRDMREVEIFRLIIPFMVVLIFRIGAVFLGYYFGKNKNDGF